MKEVLEEPVFPGIFMYSKKYGAVLFETEEEVEALDKSEWFDSPAFDAPKATVKKYKGAKPLEKMSKLELIEAGASIDIPKEELTSLKKEEIIELLK